VAEMQFLYANTDYGSRVRNEFSRRHFYYDRYDSDEDSDVYIDIERLKLTAVRVYLQRHPTFDLNQCSPMVRPLIEKGHMELRAERETIRDNDQSKRTKGNM